MNHISQHVNFFCVGFSKGVRKLSTKSQLKELLISMPKETAHVPVLKEGRKVKKENLIKYPAGIINLQVLGNGSKGAPRSLYVFTDQTRYLFNCGEGTQRLAHEHKMKLAKLEHIFVTNKSWDNTGGLPGVALTIQDIGVPEITLHGPPKIEKLFEGTKRFVILKDLKIKVANMSLSRFEDHIMQVDYVKLHPSASDDSADKSSSSEESVIEEDETDYYAPIKGCKRHLEITQENSEESLKRTKVDGEKEDVHNQNLNAETPDMVMCFICRPRKKEGMLLIEKCVEMGVPAGPLLGKLKAGNDVTLPNGNIVKAVDVRSPDMPGPVFIVVDCPDESYIDSLTCHPSLLAYQSPETPENVPHIIVHFTPLRVMLTPKYKEWTEKFPISTRHMMINDACTGMGSEAVHRIQHKLSLLDKDMFPMLNEEGVEKYYPATEEANSNKLDVLQKPDNLSEYQVPVMMGCTLLKYVLRPTTELDSTSSLIINPEEDTREVMELQDFTVKLNELKSKVAALKTTEDGSYPEFIFLGTGSCIPNKTRNTSAILVHTDPSSCILLDCGEGTYGQLVRFFGNKKADEVLSKIKAIYISHLHADHHIGLIQLIRKRFAALKDRNSISPVYLLAPHQIQTWLHLYNKFFEKIRDAYQLLPNVQFLRQNADALETSVLASEVKQVLQLQQIQTTFVRHCPNAFGVALTHSSGWKITYSGDTMPCNNLVEIGKDSDVLIHEATMEDELKQEAVVKMHSTTSEAIEIGNRMSAKFILLTHFSQRYAKVPKINEKFGSNVGIAFDNMRVRKCDLPKIPLMYGALNTMFNEDVEDMEQKTMRRLKRKEFEAMNLKVAPR